jgi:uncharacterized protein (DUF1501 family)
VKITRREVLKGSALAAASGVAGLPGIGRLLFAAEPDAPGLLVVLHLRGGCDGLNLLSPAGDADFDAARSSELRVAADGIDAGHLLRHAQPGAPQFRLHTAAAPLADMAAAGHLAFIHAAGLSDATRSHFVATDMIEHGVANAAGLNHYADGWLARALAAQPELGALQGVSGVSLSNAPSGAWSGDARLISIADLGNGVAVPGGAAAARVLGNLYAPASDNPVARAGRLTLESMAAVDSRLARDAKGKVLPYQAEAHADYDAAAEFARPMRALAQLIKLDIGLQAATVDLGGWDTHEGQAGRFPRLVERLSRGLAAFYNDLSRYQDRLTLVVLTEFGRRLRANRSGGTDHGRGSVMLVLGGRVAGGTVLGAWPGLKSEQLDEGVDLAVANDYRQVLSEVLAHWRGGALETAARTFPGFRAAPTLGLFG